MSGRGQRCGRGQQAVAQPLPGTGQNRRTGGAAAFGLLQGIDFNDLLSPDADRIFAGLPSIRTLTNGRGIVRTVPIPERERSVILVMVQSRDVIDLPQTGDRSRLRGPGAAGV